MYLAKEFSEDPQYRSDALSSTGVTTLEKPLLLVQFASNVPSEFAAACLHARNLGAWGADLNLGCPQLRAKAGHYGSYLQEDVTLCCSLLRAAHEVAGFDGKFAITVKIRLQSTLEQTLEYANRLKEAGAVMICVHGRQRGSINARRDGSADLESVKEVVDALYPFPVISNGNVQCPQDIVDNLKANPRAAGVAVAEEILRYPAIFDDALTLLAGREIFYEESDRRHRLLLLGEYLDICNEFDKNGVIVREDFSEWVKTGGGMVRADSRPGSTSARYSNWWPHGEVVKQHCRRIIDATGLFKDICQRSTFRKTRWLSELDTFLRKRLNIPGLEMSEEEVMVNILDDVGDEEGVINIFFD